MKHSQIRSFIMYLPNSSFGEIFLQVPISLLMYKLLIFSYKHLWLLGVTPYILRPDGRKQSPIYLFTHEPCTTAGIWSLQKRRKCNMYSVGIWLLKFFIYSPCINFCVSSFLFYCFMCFSVLPPCFQLP